MGGAGAVAACVFHSPGTERLPRAFPRIGATGGASRPLIQGGMVAAGASRRPAASPLHCPHGHRRRHPPLHPRRRDRQLQPCQRRPRHHPAHRHQARGGAGGAAGRAAVPPQHARRHAHRGGGGLLRQVQGHRARAGRSRQPGGADAVARAGHLAHQHLGGLRPPRADAAGAALHAAAPGAAGRPELRRPLRQPGGAGHRPRHPHGPAGRFLTGRALARRQPLGAGGGEDLPRRSTARRANPPS